MQPILDELNDLNKQYDNLLATKTNNSISENYDKIINHLKITIINKLNTINFNLPQTRNKRSLFPHIGSLLKTITGNLDEEDGTRFRKIINDIETNGQNLQQQMNLQYTLNTETIKRFELTIKNVEHNEELLAQRITEIAQMTDKGHDPFIFMEPTYNQLIILYNNLYNILQEIENSLTFCQTKTFHPSILRFEELQIELNKLESLHKGQIPIRNKSLSELQTLIDVSCKVKNHKIIYFLSFPINFDTDFNLYFLLPIPTLNNLVFTTILPKNKYLLKSDRTIKPLKEMCASNNPIQCFSNNLDHSNPDECETQILQAKQLTNCQYSELEVEGNYIDYIAEINQYLVVFSKLDILKLDLDTGIETKELQGIFLIELTNGKLIYRDELLDFQQVSSGKPFILNNINVNITKFSDIKIKLKNLRLDDIQLNQIIPKAKTPEKIYNWRLVEWPYLILIVFMLVLSLVIRTYFCVIFEKLWKAKPINNPISNSVNINLEELHPKISLPEGAKI